MGKAGDNFNNIAEKEGFAVTQEREKAEFGKGGKGDRRHINADRLRQGEKSIKIIIDYVDGSHVGVSGDNRVEEGIDSGQSSSVGPHIIPHLYPISSYRPSHSPLSHSVYLIPLLLHYPLEIGGGLCGTHHRK